MAYSKTDWTNNVSPYINATNLDKMETGIDEAHDAIDNTSTGHDHDGTDSKKVIAGNITNTPAGNIAATDVQAAITELDTEKESTSTSHASRHVTGGGDTIADVIAAGNAGLMTGSDKTKIDGIEALADITDATNVDAAGAVMVSELSHLDSITVYPSFVNTSSTTYVIKKEMQLDEYLYALKISFKMQCWNASYTAFARIYRNGSPVGTEQTLDSTSWTTKTELITGWTYGDLIQIYIKTDSSGEARVTSFQVENPNVVSVTENS